MSVPAASVTCATSGLSIPECACPQCIASQCMCSACRPKFSADTQPKENA